MFFVVAVVEEEEGDGRKAAGEAEVEQVPVEARARREVLEAGGGGWRGGGAPGG